MADGPVCEPTYRTDRVLLYEADARATLLDIQGTHVDIVLTDAPYFAWAHIADNIPNPTDLTLDLHRETLWESEAFYYALLWVPLVRTLRPGVAWFFCEPHYAGTYIRIARYLGWPMVGWWPSLRGDEHEEYLLAFSDDVSCLQDVAPARVRRALRENTWGQEKSPITLGRIIDLSLHQLSFSRLAIPTAPVVFDPFCGSGTTLEAALRCGCRAIGIERNPDIMAQAVSRVVAATKE